MQRKVDVGQVVREGDVLAVLDDADYRLAEDAARQQWTAAVTQARQAESDRKRLGALKSDGSVSVVRRRARPQRRARRPHAAAEAEARKLELARNRLKYTVLRASRSGVVTAVRFEVGPGRRRRPAGGRRSPTKASPRSSSTCPRTSSPPSRRRSFKAIAGERAGRAFDVALRELSPQAAAQTRTYRARLKPRQRAARCRSAPPPRWWPNA